MTLTQPGYRDFSSAVCVDGKSMALETTHPKSVSTPRHTKNCPAGAGLSKDSIFVSPVTGRASDFEETMAYRKQNSIGRDKGIILKVEQSPNSEQANAMQCFRQLES